MQQQNESLKRNNRDNVIYLSLWRCGLQIQIKRNENSRCKTANLPFTTVANKRIRAVARSTTVFRASTKIDEETGKDRGYCPELSNIACPPVRLYCIGTARPMLPAGNGALQRNFRKPL
uniref:Uncharacterized protein n=1 Tax=Vespula pensylvanica TaxID=30213 RepID=A0A834P0A2_VESPE|nr:hypothetical protein H0235_008596 [Vespula pensylvanica]